MQILILFSPRTMASTVVYFLTLEWSSGADICFHRKFLNRTFLFHFLRAATWLILTSLMSPFIFHANYLIIAHYFEQFVLNLNHLKILGISMKG